MKKFVEASFKVDVAGLPPIFMDAKSDEIVAVFSDGPRFDASQLTEYLSRISPINLSKWNTIK